MAWNEPGGDDKDRWGKPGNDQGPPDLDEVVRKIQDKLGGLFGGKKGGGSGGSGGSGGGGGPVAAANRGMFVVVGLLLAALYAYSCFYVVAPAERAVVLRFGKAVDTHMPGPHWAWWPIETVLKDNVDEIRTIEIGYRVGGRGQQGMTSVPREALMLTRDENIVDIKFAVQFKIKELGDYLFSVLDPIESLREVTESTIREVVGKSDMDFVLTEGRSDIAARVAELTQQVLDTYQTGLQVTSINMQSAQAPDEVQEAFDDAVKAREDQQRLINEAEAYANDILPKARGFAQRQIEEANAYKEQVIAQSEGEAARFDQILTEYRKAPDVTRQRLYLEMMEGVLRDSNKVVVDVESGNNLLLLPLDKALSGSGASVPQGDQAQRVIDGLSDAIQGAVSSNRSSSQDTQVEDARRDSVRRRERP